MITYLLDAMKVGWVVCFYKIIYLLNPWYHLSIHEWFTIMYQSRVIILTKRVLLCPCVLFFIFILHTFFGEHEPCNGKYIACNSMLSKMSKKLSVIKNQKVASNYFSFVVTKKRKSNSSKNFFLVFINTFSH